MSALSNQQSHAMTSPQLALVTGADGFIGSHLVEEMLRRGMRVRAFVCYNSFNSWGWLDTLPKDLLAQLDVFAGDVRDPNGVRDAVTGCSTVFHLAALIAIPFSYHSPDSYIDTNIKGTLNVLQAARSQGVERVLVTSTSEVYGTAQYAPIDEQHPFQGQSPYSASKIGADRIAESFYRSFALPVVIVRPFNTYGPRQSARAVIPTIITQLLSGATELKLGSTRPTRDFNYVQDTVEGFLAIAAAASDQVVGQEINIASGTEVSVGQIAEELLRQLNPTARIVTDDERVRPECSEVLRLIGDNRKIRALAGWAPRFDLATGLAATIAWFRKPDNLSRYKSWLYNI
jgi:NAD dependent epimerase/dehydratase